MVQPIIQELITHLKTQLKKSGIHIDKIILFGSYSTEKATSNSDVDIIIVSDDFKGKDIFERAEMIKEVYILTLKQYHLPLDIILLSSDEYHQETTLAASLAQEGLIV